MDKYEGSDLERGKEKCEERKHTDRKREKERVRESDHRVREKKEWVGGNKEKDTHAYTHRAKQITCREKKTAKRK